MIIDRFKVTNFKKFSDLNIEFQRGINIVVGPNEAGKSTLTRAIIKSLYADPTTKSKAFYKQISPWNKQNDLSFELAFHNSDAKFLLKKDFKAKSIVLENIDTGLKLTSYKEVNKAIKELTGIPTKEIYESTAFVKQSDVISIDNSNDFIASIQKAASSNSSKVNVQNIVSELEKELRKLNVGVKNPAKHPGPIKQLTDKISQLKTELIEKKNKWEKVNTESVSKKDFDSRLEEITDSISLTEKLIENYRKRKESVKQIEILNKQITQIEKKINTVSDSAANQKTIKESMAKYSQLESVDINKSDKVLGELVAAKKVIDGEINRLNELLEQSKNRKVKVNSNKLLTVGIVTAILSLVISAVIAVVISNYIVVAIGLIIGVVAIGSAWIIQQIRPQYKNDEEGAAGISHQIGLMEVKAKENHDSLRQFLTKFAVQNENEYYTLRGEYLTNKERLKEIEGGIKGTLGNSTFDQIKQQQLELMTQKKQIEQVELTEEVRSAEFTPEQYLAKTRELDKLYLEKKQLEHKQTESAVRVEDAEVSRSDIVNLEEQLAGAEEDFVFYQKKASALEIAIETLKESVSETADNASKIVSNLVEQYLPKLTKGRYKNARLKSDLGIEVFSDEKNDWVDPVGNLSAGTVDQIYFLARIAFLKNLTHDTSVPIILDDPFVTFDKERRVEANDILQDLVKSNQIILLTHEEIYNDWGHVIELEKVVS